MGEMICRFDVGDDREFLLLGAFWGKMVRRSCRVLLFLGLLAIPLGFVWYDRDLLCNWWRVGILKV